MLEQCLFYSFLNNLSVFSEIRENNHCRFLRIIVGFLTGFVEPVQKIGNTPINELDWETISQHDGFDTFKLLVNLCPAAANCEGAIEQRRYKAGFVVERYVTVIIRVYTSEGWLPVHRGYIFMVLAHDVDIKKWKGIVYFCF